jgi:hypothetical protein
MRTCWVIDHPAHFQLFAPWIRAGEEGDILIVAERDELDLMLENAPLPEREVIRVPRPVGRAAFIRAHERMDTVRSGLRKKGIERIIVKGASLELRVAKRLGIAERWYLSDTESNSLAHRLAKGSATDVVLPLNWLGGPVATAARQHRYPGILPHAYLQPPERVEKSTGEREQRSRKPLVFRRDLLGGGIHDRNELVDYSELADRLPVDFDSVGEGEAGDWDLPTRLLEYNGVLTGSTTLAAEAACQGIPTLLISRAQRGFLAGLPALYRDNQSKQWFESLNSEPTSPDQWPETLAILQALWGPTQLSQSRRMSV